MNDIDKINQRLDRVERKIAVLSTAFLRRVNLNAIEVSPENEELVEFIVEMNLTFDSNIRVVAVLGIDERFDISFNSRYRPQYEVEELQASIASLKASGLKLRYLDIEKSYG